MRDVSAHELFEAMAEERRQEETFVLCTILKKTGSGPRGVGTHMLVSGTGTVIGTVGGGNVEHLAELEAAKMLEESSTAFRTICYDIGDGRGDDTGMVCGGDVVILFQREGTLPRDVLEKAAGWRPGHEEGYFFMRIRKAALTAGAVLKEEAPREILRHGGRNPFYEENEEGRASDSKGEQITPGRDNQSALYIERITERGRVYVIGAGHVARALVPVLAGIDFAVTVVDDRKELIDTLAFPLADEVLCTPYENLQDVIHVTEDDWVVVMTKGHVGDYEALAQTLSAHPRYIGCIGSRKKAAFVREKLFARGFSEEEVNRIFSPVGLSIGAQTPAEIAVSIAAQMIEVRSGT